MHGQQGVQGGTTVNVLLATGLKKQQVSSKRDEKLALLLTFSGWALTFQRQWRLIADVSVAGSPQKGNTSLSVNVAIDCIARKRTKKSAQRSI